MTTIPHYADSSSLTVKATDLVQTWCGKSVPASETTTLRSRVKCPDCRTAAGIR